MSTEPARGRTYEALQIPSCLWSLSLVALSLPAVQDPATLNLPAASQGSPILSSPPAFVQAVFSVQRSSPLQLKCSASLNPQS